MKRIYLSLGSNIGNREAKLQSAIERLAPDVQVLRVSPVYETEPLEYTEQVLSPRARQSYCRRTCRSITLTLQNSEVSRLQDFSRRQPRPAATLLARG